MNKSDFEGKTLSELCAISRQVNALIAAMGGRRREPARAHLLLDTIIHECRIGRDSDLAKLLGVENSYVSNIRNRQKKAGPAFIARIESKIGTPAARVRELLGEQA